MIWGLAAVGAILLALPGAPRFRFATLVSIALLAVAVFQTAEGRERFSLTFTTMVLLTLALLALLQRRLELLPLAFVPFLLFLVLGKWLLWPAVGGLRGNSLNLLIFVAAWTAGLWLGSMYCDLQEGLDLLARIVVVIIAFELVVTILQLAGMPVFPTSGRTLQLEGGRVNGTFSHPSTPGKVITLLLVFLLPATRAEERSTRRLAYFGVVAGAVPVFASLSRANTVALLAMILVWSLIQPRERYLTARFALPGAVGIGLLFFVDDILGRFAADPVGGKREHLLEVALYQLTLTPLFGVGPGLYLHTVGQYDQLTSEGWPVHNIFVLETVELGFVGAVLLFSPLLMTFVAALRARRSTSEGGDFSRAVIAYVPALVLIGTTGWGLIDVSMGAMLMFTLGFAHVQIHANYQADEGLSVPKTDRPAPAYRR